jgi:hypothetical protein
MKGFVRFLIPILALVACFGVTNAQNVSNVYATQAGQAIHITYDLDRAADISVYVSTDGGEHFKKLYRVSGDVGKTIGPGHKTIVWDVQSEMEEFVSDDVKFKVHVDGNAESEWRKKLRVETQEKKEPKEAVIPKEKDIVLPYSTFFTLNMAYSPLPQWSFGFKVGGMKKVGWYASLMTNFNFKGWGNTFQEGECYGLTGESKTIRFSAQAGLVVRPCKPLSLLFGVGYGYRAFLYQVNEYWFDGSPRYPGGLCYPERTYQGVDLSAGLLFDIKGFALSAEVVTTHFQTFEMRFGVGFCVPHEKKQKSKN